jgi:hypothetical protein
VAMRKMRTFAVEVPIPGGKWHQVALIAVDAPGCRAVSQYLDVKDEHGDTLVTLTWKSSVRLQEVG